MTDTTTLPVKVSDAKRERLLVGFDSMTDQDTPTNMVNWVCAIIEELEFTWADVREGDVVEWVFLSDGSLGHFIANNRTYANWVGNLLRVDRKDANGDYKRVFERGAE